MKNKRKKPTSKELQRDLQTLFNVMSSINHTTDTLRMLIENYLEQIDLVLIMSVEPGFGGQKFMPEVLEKTKKIKELIDKKNLKAEIEIDGGINFENCALAKKAGANILVSGSTIFKENQGDLEKNIGILRTN